jgi:hypothetical protein
MALSLLMAKTGRMVMITAEKNSKNGRTQLSPHKRKKMATHKFLNNCAHSLARPQRPAPPIADVGGRVVATKRRDSRAGHPLPHPAEAATAPTAAANERLHPIVRS